MYSMFRFGNPNVTKLSEFKLSFKAVNSRVQTVKATNSRVQKIKAVNSKVQKYRGQIYLCVHTTTIIKYLWDNKLVVK